MGNLTRRQIGSTAGDERDDAMLDIVIRGGTIVDGSGAAARQGDVGIRDGQVVAVGHVDEPASRAIDADGLVVAPGFVDPHTHYDAQLFWDPVASPSNVHGVTSVIGGNCGFTLAPVHEEDADYLRRMMAQVEGMPLAALEQGVPWSWETFEQYLGALEGNVGVNAGFLVGHCAIRRYVMGAEAVEREATDAEVAAMVRELHTSIEAGGLGFSTTLSYTHSDGDGKPVASRWASHDEVLALCAAVRDHEGTTLEAIVDGCLDQFSDEEIELFTNMSVAGQRPLNWNVLTVDSRVPERVTRQLQASSIAADAGGRLVALTMPVIVPMNMSFKTYCALFMLPGWKEVMLLPVPERIAKLRDPETRRWMNERAQSDEAGVFRRLADWQNYVLGDTYSVANEGLKGRTVKELAAERETAPFDTLLDIVINDDLRTILWPIAPDGDAASWELRKTVWEDPRDGRRLRRGRAPRPDVRRAVYDPVPGRHDPRAQAGAVGGGGPDDHESAGRSVRAPRPRPAGGRRPRGRGPVRPGHDRCRRGDARRGPARRRGAADVDCRRDPPRLRERRRDGRRQRVDWRDTRHAPALRSRHRHRLPRLMVARPRWRTSWPRVLGIVGLVVAMSACTLVPRGGDGVPGSHRWRPVLPTLHAEPDPVSGGRIVDAAGREVLLRGVNVNALVEYWRYGAFPTTFPLTEADADRISATGWSVVRLLVSWSRVEPSPGHYDDAYLDQVARAVQTFERRGVYTIIDFHQDAWGPTLAAPVGLTCPAGTEPAFGWDGAPGWATLDGGASRCVPAGIRELSPAVRAAFIAFWNDAPGPGGVGIQTRYTRMLGHVAQRFARRAAVAGYDIMNEPNAFGTDEVAALGRFSASAVAAIRAGERVGGGLAHLVFFEPSATWSDLLSGTPPDFPHDANVVFAPHIYRGGISSGPIQRADFDRARSDAATFGGAPVLVGEWGSSPDRANDPADVYFREHQALQDEFHFGASLWTWRESCGDPHKAGDALAGRVPYVWGEFELDCRINQVTGAREALVSQLDRGYVRAAPGRLLSTTFDPATGELRGAGERARLGRALLAWYPKPAREIRHLSAVGLAHLHVSSSGSDGGSYVTGIATRSSWSFTVAPTS